MMQAQSLQNSLSDKLTAMTIQGKFSIKKVYLCLIPQYQKVAGRSISLQPNMHPRYKFILWLVAWRRLAIVDRLLEFNIHVPMECCFCDTVDETLDHRFFACPATNDLWCRLLHWLGLHETIGTWQEELQWA
ncbi:uncharacterized protein LOC132054276 [Lycium ferocissimum]|uniref:uncharacterized protein LOC132054276 n=1 Tax=Lycium ferocissimum TaxID=112874 RepID=UPI002814BA4C|nr:uncharacterized protein LOC132054276 [Lycium ferocissimum]